MSDRDEIEKLAERLYYEGYLEGKPSHPEQQRWEDIGPAAQLTYYYRARYVIANFVPRTKMK